jgi:hypothetical protein
MVYLLFLFAPNQSILQARAYIQREILKLMDSAGSASAGSASAGSTGPAGPAGPAGSVGPAGSAGSASKGSAGPAKPTSSVARNLHGDALSLLDCVSEMPPNGLVVTENVCFDTNVRVPAFAYYYDESGTSAAIKERIAYYYTTKK